MSLKHSPTRQTAGEVFMNQRATAELLGLSERSVERFRREGRGPVHRRFGRRVMYGRDDVLEWADAQRRSSTSDTGKAA